jgi:hypothetical protein
MAAVGLGQLHPHHRHVVRAALLHRVGVQRGRLRTVEQLLEEPGPPGGVGPVLGAAAVQVAGQQAHAAGQLAGDLGVRLQREELSSHMQAALHLAAHAAVEQVEGRVDVR